MKRESIITGTLWLTGAGLITRLLGFVYRIYLSNLIGSEGMGLYQLISPIYFLLFTLCSAGCHTAISQLVAAEHARKHHSTIRRILWLCLLPSALLGLLCAISVYSTAPWIAAHILHDTRAAEGIRILCLGLPFCISSTCLKAYFHGLRHMHVPAIEQVIEQLCRMAVIYHLSPLFSGSNIALTCRYVVYGTLAGDLVSCLYTFVAYGLHSRQDRRTSLPSSINPTSYHKLLPSIWLIVLPVTGSRLLTQLLSSLENILLPTVLQRSGLSSTAALSVYGEFGGMVMPLLTFPTIITGALSANLLPLVAGAKAGGNLRRIHSAIHQSLRLTFMMAFLFTALFAALGLLMGQLTVQAAQQQGLGVLSAQAGDGLQALGLLDLQGFGLGQAGFRLAAAGLHFLFLLINAALLAGDLRAALLDLLVGLGAQAERLVLGLDHSLFAFLFSGLDCFVDDAGGFCIGVADGLLRVLVSGIVVEITDRGTDSKTYNTNDDRRHQGDSQCCSLLSLIFQNMEDDLPAGQTGDNREKARRPGLGS